MRAWLLLLLVLLPACEHEELGVRSIAFALEPVLATGAAGELAIAVEHDSGQVTVRGVPEPSDASQLVLVVGLAATERDALVSGPLDELTVGVLMPDATPGGWRLFFGSADLAGKSLGALRTAAIKRRSATEGVLAPALLFGDARTAKPGAVPAPTGGGHEH